MQNYDVDCVPRLGELGTATLGHSLEDLGVGEAKLVFWSKETIEMNKHSRGKWKITTFTARPDCGS